MLHQRLARVASLFLAVAALGAVSALPQTTHAASARALVWVAEDETAQARCTSGGTPCPAGSAVVLWVHTVPLAQAQAARQPYVALDASPDQ